jgi:hypothetical protein
MESFQDSTPTASSLVFTGGSDIYQFQPQVRSVSLLDHLDARLTQLAAMLSLVTGEGHDNFAAHSDEIQHNFLWACSMMVDECIELRHAMNRATVDPGLEQKQTART